MSEKIKGQHLERGAYVYVRQSTPYQVRNHLEGKERQYALAERANQLGGIVNLRMKLKHWCYEEGSVSILRLSVLYGDHQLCGVGLPSLLPELPRCRGSSRRAGNHRVV
jgi:hypothetical protein